MRAEAGLSAGRRRQASPFSFDRYYAMDNGRAERLGFDFATTAHWLPEAVAAAVGPRKDT